MIKRLRECDPKRAAAWIFCIICVTLGVYFFFKYALGLFLPFIIALFLALLTVAPSHWMCRKTGIPQKVCSVILLCLVLILISSLIFFGLNRLIYEIEKLLSDLADGSSQIGASISSIFDRISAIGNEDIPIIQDLMKIEIFRELGEKLDTVVATAIMDAVSSFAKKLPNLLFSLVTGLPQYLIFIIVTLIASFYLCIDYDKIKKAAVSCLPEGLAARLPAVKKALADTASKYIRAYLLLLLLTFVQLFVGFSILGTPYPLLIAFAVALVDLLPILGVGTVLIPWGLFELIVSRNMFLGLGLLVLYIIVIVVRQVTEPRVVAESLGLHPLITLLSMYLGLRLFGIFGMLIGPIVALTVKALTSSGIDKTRAL